jgi:heterotetrameric sarcosine oxidase gamma subunit
VSAPEPVSPFARCLEIGRFGADGPGSPLQTVQRRLAIARVMARAGDADTVCAAVEKDTGLKLPSPGHTSTSGDVTAIWIAPATWLVMQAKPNSTDLLVRIARACGAHASVVDQSCGYVALQLSGARARDVLAKGCRIDLHPRAFGPGRAAATIIAHVHGIVWQVDQVPTFELIVPSTLAEHVYEWLCISAAEFGYEVRA